MIQPLYKTCAANEKLAIRLIGYFCCLQRGLPQIYYSRNGCEHMCNKVVFNVKDFCAVGDGITYDTDEIQNAIDAASRNNGKVFFPSGTYLIGTIYLKSNIKIELSDQAVLIGATDIRYYGNDTHYNRYDNETFLDKCLIYAEDCENITITGGTIDGNGSYFYEEGKKDVVHPMLFRFLRCQNIRVEGIQINMPAGWSMAFLECDYVWANKVKIISRHLNGDGLDFDSCRNVFVSECYLDTSDDCLCIQNSVSKRPSYNITVRSCVMKSYWAAIRIGLLNNGDIENVIISDCIFEDVACSGFKIQATECGSIRNIIMNNIIMRNVSRPIFVTSNFCQMGKFKLDNKDGSKGINGLRFNNIYIDNSNLQNCEGTEGLFIVGTPERRIKNIGLVNLYLISPGRAVAENIPSELGENRPEYYNIGNNPASGLFIRHLDELYMERVEIQSLTEDAREQIVMDDVKNIKGEFSCIKIFEDTD